MGHGTDDIGISGVCDGKGAHTEIFTTSSTQFDVVARVMMDSGFGQHSVVFDLGFPENVTSFVKSLLDKSLAATASVNSRSKSIKRDLPEGRGVVGDDHQFSLAHTQSIEGLFVAQAELA